MVSDVKELVAGRSSESHFPALDHLHRQAPFPPTEWETLVVDNASSDGTPEAVGAQFPSAHVLRNRRNDGVPARNVAFRRARGECIISLDDDSYPIGDTVGRLLAYMDGHPEAAVVTGRVVLPDGSCEASALPSVMIGGASCIRRSVLEEVGYLPAEFMRQAEEYDLSFRIWNAGYRIERFEDLLFRHEKVSGARASSLVFRIDIRNNLILLNRYLSKDTRQVYYDDWVQRYTLLATHAGCQAASRRGQLEACWYAFKDRLRGGCQRLRPEVLETIFAWKSQAKGVRDWACEYGVKRVAIADFSKNIYATYRACKLAGLERLLGRVTESCRFCRT